jgi:hypothetical protein
MSRERPSGALSQILRARRRAPPSGKAISSRSLATAALPLLCDFPQHALQDTGAILGRSMAGTCPCSASPGLLDAKSPRQVDKQTLHALSPLPKGSLSRYLLLVTTLRSPRLTWRSNWIFLFGDNPCAPVSHDRAWNAYWDRNANIVVVLLSAVDAPTIWATRCAVKKMLCQCWLISWALQTFHKTRELR